MNQSNIVIIGGGYAGIMCALRLAHKAPTHHITLINPSPNFTERLRLHEGLAIKHSTDLRSFNIAKFLSKSRVKFIQAKVETIDRINWQLTYRDVQQTPQKISYDRLVIAIGSKNRTNIINGLDENSYVMDKNQSNGCEALKTQLKTHKTPNITILGAGATGVEVAAELALNPNAKITLIDHGTFGKFAQPDVAKYIRKQLKNFNVNLLENTTITQVTSQTIQTKTQTIPFDICISALGFTIGSLAKTVNLPTSNNGRIMVDGALRSTADTRIYVAGDAALPTNPCGAPPRMSVFFALTTGAFIASTIADDLACKNLKKFNYWTYGQAIGLGKIAIGYNNLRFDIAHKPYFTGRAAYHLRHFFVCFLFQLLKIERKFPGLPFYLGQPLKRTIQNGAK